MCLGIFIIRGGYVDSKVKGKKGVAIFYVNDEQNIKLPFQPVNQWIQAFTIKWIFYTFQGGRGVNRTSQLINKKKHTLLKNKFKKK